MRLRRPLLARCLASLLAITLLAACGEGNPGDPTETTMAEGMTDTTMSEMADATMSEEMMTDTTSG